MNYQRLEKVISHLELHSDRNTYYKGLLRQYQLLKQLSEKQIKSVEISITEDNRKRQITAIREIKNWNNQQPT